MANKKSCPFPEQIHVIVDEDANISEEKRGENLIAFDNPDFIYQNQTRADGKVPIAVYKLTFIGTIEVKQNANLVSVGHSANLKERRRKHRAQS